MRLYLAVAVLMLAFVAYTEAQEETIGETFSKLSEKVSELSRTVAESTKNAMERAHNSEAAVNARRWFSDTWETMTNAMKSGWDDLTQ